MNNIFKVIWNHATQTWTVVGELASAKGKSKSVKLAAISTALLMAATGVEAANVVSEAGELGQLSIATNKVTDQFYGNDNYKAKTGLSNNVAGATVNAYDGIAIGNGAVSGGADSTTGGNAHVAIGLMAHASGGGSNAQNAAVALGAYSLAIGQGGTAIGAHSFADGLNSTALGKVAKANSDGSTAVGTNTTAEWQGTALGNTAAALANYATSIGVNSKANSHSSISIGRAAVISGQNAIGVGTETKVNGVGTVAVGSGTNVSSANVSTLGSNITVAAGRDGAVVLGHNSSAEDPVIAVHSAKIGDKSKLTYTGFAGDLGGTNNKGKNTAAASDKQGNFVSVGSEDNERQIKHVAAGRITADSTDALNGSQLYSVAKTLGNVAEGLADTLGVDLNEDGTVKNKFSQPLTIADGSDYNKGKPAITAPNVTTALTNLNNYVNAGWNVTASGNDYKNNVSVGHTVNFVGTGNVDVKGSNVGNVRTINISVDSPVDYTTTTANVGGNDVNVVKANDGKWYKKGDMENGMPKNGVDPIPANTPIVKQGATLKDSNNKPYEKGNTYTYDDKGNITATVYDATKPESKDEITAGKNGVQLNNVGWATKPDQAVNKDQLDQTVNKSGFYVQQNGLSTLKKNPDENDTTKYEKVTPNDVINFADGHGTRVRAVTKRDETTGVDKTTVYVDVYAPTKPNSLPAVYTDENGNKLQPGGNGYYPEDAVKINDKWYPAGTTEDNVAKAKELTPVSNVIISMNNPNSLAKTAGDPVAVTNVGKGTKNYDDQTAGEKSPAYKDAINGLANLEGSKDSNVLTVADAKNFGWVVSTSDNQKATAVKNADVVDFKAEEGTGITVEGKLDDTNTKMTVTVGNKHFKTNTKNTVPAAKATGENSVAIGGNSNAAAKDAIAIGNGAEVAPTAAQGSVAIGARAKAGKANVGSYSIDPSATVAGKTGPDTRVVSVGDKGNEAQIQNVAPGVISETSTDAVNGSQLHSVIKNLNNSNDYLDRKVNKHSKQARAGIAGANAAAALPQAYTQGRAMVAAAAGTFKGQNALAVGYSRISDNGKVILKLQGNANTSGDVGAGVGVGYQW
ncbi:YadA-like family protein [Haemophilus parainfluenzae]|uniref:IgD binding protein/hemagglutinin MID n=1 Tax=Haemophilus parainfluenzae TaxID=729 RepID=A0A377JIA6_HAEPA|nr:YadA-like family protein [Haemophilus parainfluenzae]STP05316.1 IgD binding protein/hemagglutinin MID [Haemophilus parainfluenzae]